MPGKSDVKNEMRDLFGQREGEQRQAKVKSSKGVFGSTFFLMICFTLGCALAAWPFLKTISHDPQPAGPPLYYKAPANADIVPASYTEETIDLFFFAGCAHQRRLQLRFHPPVTHLTEGVKIDTVPRS